MTSAQLTLPGSIPGLLRRCSPIVAAKRTHTWIPRGTRGVTHGPIRWHVHGVLWDRADILAPYTRELCYAPAQLHTLVLDLTDETGRAHAAWWLEGRVYPTGFVERERQAFRGIVQPDIVHRSGPDGIVDDIDYGYAAFVFGDSFFMGEDCGPEFGTAIPSLNGLDPNDPRKLDDGSRWVDAEALRRVCLHVAGMDP